MLHNIFVLGNKFNFSKKYVIYHSVKVTYDGN